MVRSRFHSLHPSWPFWATYATEFIECGREKFVSAIETTPFVPLGQTHPTFQTFQIQPIPSLCFQNYACQSGRRQTDHGADFCAFYRALCGLFLVRTRWVKWVRSRYLGRQIWPTLRHDGPQVQHEYVLGVLDSHNCRLWRCARCEKRWENRRYHLDGLRCRVLRLYYRLYSNDFERDRRSRIPHVDKTRYIARVLQT